MVFERIARSWSLLKETWRIVMTDKELLVYPFLAAVISLAFVGTFFILPLLAPSAFSASAFIAGFFIAYFGAYIIGMFFSACIVAVANMRIEGKNPKFADGIRIAGKNIHRIILWALLAATVGIILSNLSKRGRAGGVASFFISIAWNLMTFFVLPVMIIEKRGVIDSIKRSWELFKKTWGESVVGTASIGMITGLAMIPGFLLIFASFSLRSVAILSAFAIAFVYLVLLALVSSALNGVYRTALYNYAAKRKIPKGFSSDFVKNAYRKRPMQMSGPLGHT